MEEETVDLIKRFPQIDMYKSILRQMQDISNNIKNNIYLNYDEIFKRYTLGAIATKNFDCDNDLYGRKLQDVFGGLIDYAKMPEE